MFINNIKIIILYNKMDKTLIFIEKAKKIHGDKYNYSKVDYKKAYIKVIIICDTHGPFEQSPKKHLLNRGCKICNMNKLKFNPTLFIEKAKQIHNDRYDYSETIYKSSIEKVTIICIAHGPFEQNPSSHLYGNGCPKCGRKECGNKTRSNTDIFVEKAKKVHGDKYNYTKTIYTKSINKIIITCYKHGDFEQLVSQHLQGRGCFQCGSELRGNNQRFDIITFIQKAKMVHGDKYDYSNTVYIKSDELVTIICSVHGIFEQIANTHLQGGGCPRCSNQLRANKKKSDINTFIEKAIRIHGDKYDYTETIYTESRNQLNIICKIHGLFEQTGNNHLQGKGCQKCAKLVTIEKLKSNNETFIEKAQKIHNNIYDYSRVEYINAYTKVTIICKNHGPFQQSPTNHLSKKGCSKCQMCQSCLLWMTNGRLCAYCKPQTQKNSLYMKTKEMDVVKFLKDNLPNTDFIHNKSVGTDCTDGHLFPDILFNCNWYNLIVEVDEFKHRGSAYECDKKRMYDIIAKTGLPCIFIRYNPDNKNSDKNVLLNKINKYLNLTLTSTSTSTSTDTKWDIHGFKAKYLFY
jgi:hypothetical protein